MLRKISFILLYLCALMPINTYSMVIHSLPMGATLEYDLPPHDPQLFINYMFWTIEATCKITMEEEAIDLFAEVLAKKGKINNTPLSVGQTMQVRVYNGEVLKLSAESGAKVKITNLGNHVVHATCNSL